MTEQTTGEVQLYTFADPKYIFNIGDGALVVTTYRWPNRFHRFMQRLLLGIKWEERT
jgi:hypothetical protein